MADSNITKAAMGDALKQLMQEMPFEKINIGQICELCGMNRKSFYYHFKDKYDLLNWIFDVEVIPFLIRNDSQVVDHDLMITDFCRYLYDNRVFYRKALQVEGQNSFSDHFRSYIQPVMKTRLSALFRLDSVDDFYVDFFADACYGAVWRWLTQSPEMSGEAFAAKLNSLAGTLVAAVIRLMQEQETK